MERQMRRWSGLVLALAVVGLVGCKPADDGAGVRQALPNADSVRIKIPGGTSALATIDGVGQVQQAVLGETAQYYAFTREISDGLNTGAAWVLLLVHTVVQYPVTSIEGDTYIWGPWSDSALKPAEYRLTVEQDAAGDYLWSLEGRHKADGPAAAFIPVVTGLASPGALPHRGTGSFTMIFANAELLDPVGNDGEGTLDVVYDLESTPASVVMDFDGPGGAFHYEYAEAADGSGDFQFAIHTDIDNNGSLAEDVAVRSRWNATGAGRADLQISGGDAGTLVVTGSECWDNTFGRVYWQDSVNYQPTEGEAAACAFSDALLPGE